MDRLDDLQQMTGATAHAQRRVASNPRSKHQYLYQRTGQKTNIHPAGRDDQEIEMAVFICTNEENNIERTIVADDAADAAVQYTKQIVKGRFAAVTNYVLVREAGATEPRRLKVVGRQTIQYSVISA